MYSETLVWTTVGRGFKDATDEITGIHYHVRTAGRFSDAWMAVNATADRVLTTGVSLSHAQATCELDARLERVAL